MRNQFFILLLFIFSLSGKISAQSTSGNLEGRILDDNDQPVIMANVIITSADLQGQRGIATNDKGYFRITGLPVGLYSVKISHIAYRPVIIDDVNILLGRTTTIGNVHLTGTSVETQPVVIEESNPVIDVSSASSGRNLSAKEYSPLPIERNYFHLANLLPGVNISYKGDGGSNFAGSTGLENRYFIDGAEITNPENGLLKFELTYNFIRQIEIQTGGYQAEFRSSLGGIINAVTYSGSNEFHGSVFSFYTNNNFSNSPRLSAGSPPKGSYSNYDVGFGLGGPVISDRLWYFIAYDPSFASEEVFVKGQGLLGSNTTYHKFAGKLTWKADENNFVTLSLTGSPRMVDGILNQFPNLQVLNEAAVKYKVKNLIISGILRGIHKISDNFMVESSLSFAELDYKASPVSPEGSAPTFVDNIGRTVSGGLGLSNSINDQGLTDARLSGTLWLGSHIFKGGIEYSHSSLRTDITWKIFIRYPKYYVGIDQLQSGKVSQQNLSLFMQDSWQITDRVCLNAGLRWDPQWLIDSDGNTAQTITDQIQPRIGIIYQPGLPGAEKITASYGRFYQPLLLSLSALYHLKGAVWGQTIYPNDPRRDTSGAQTFQSLAAYVSNVPGLKGQYYDEITLGYEKQISDDVKFGLRGIYRVLGMGIEDGVLSPDDQVKYGSLQAYGNPGYGDLSMLPKMKREYRAIELTFQRFVPQGLNFHISFVISRNWGNYDGFAETYDVSGNSDLFPNNSNQFGLPERMINGEGLLPNDRSHVLKIFGSYAFDFGMTTGMIFQWMSGTPLNKLGRDATFGASTFLVQRGFAGRTPSIWDLSFRFTYDFGRILNSRSSYKLMLDVLHFASRREALDYDQYYYLDSSGNYPNPDYMVPVQFQPPMSFRLGVEAEF